MMFGKKDEKDNRLQELGQKVQQADGITQAELARELGVSRSTINKDLAVIQERTGLLFWEDDEGGLHWFGKGK